MSPIPVRRLAELGTAENSTLLERSRGAVFDPELQNEVGRIVEDVRTRGDAALVDALERFDGVRIEPARIRVSYDELEEAAREVAPPVLEALRAAVERIRRYNGRIVRDASWREELEPGLSVGEIAGPVDSAGLFVPSGKGSFPSVLAHLATPALVAGVAQIAVAVPPARGSDRVDPAVLALAVDLGLENVFRVNGPAGIAALAFGTESVPRTSVVVGPGSPAVAVAQLLVRATGTATVVLLGPSESLVVADESADPDLLAADLLTEAEHGADSAALLLTPSETLASGVAARVERRLDALPGPRHGFAEAALAGFGIFLTADLDEALAFAAEFAPEHLQLAVADPEAAVGRAGPAGEILLGQTPFALANYVLGIPNTLPTSGSARAASGVTARTFLRTSSVGAVSREAAARLTAEATPLADHEGFPAHRAALEARRT